MQQDLPRQELLNYLFRLMEESASIKNLPAEKRETIKAKYTNSSEESIRKGIRLLEEDIAKKKDTEAAAKNALMKSVETQKELRAHQAVEKEESEKLAKKILAGLDTPAEKTAKGLRIIIKIVLLAGVAIAAFFAAKYFLKR